MGVLVSTMCFFNSAIPFVITLLHAPTTADSAIWTRHMAGVLKISRLDDGVETLDSYGTGALGSLGSSVTSCKKSVTLFKIKYACSK